MEEELQHIISYDSKGKLLEGGKKYKLHLPSNIPASDFWSVIVYDTLEPLNNYIPINHGLLFSAITKILFSIMMVRLIYGSVLNLLKGKRTIG